MKTWHVEDTPANRERGGAAEGGSPRCAARSCANTAQWLIAATRGSTKPLFILQIQGKRNATSYLNTLRKPPKAHRGLRAGRPSEASCFGSLGQAGPGPQSYRGVVLANLGQGARPHSTAQNLPGGRSSRFPATAFRHRTPALEGLTPPPTTPHWPQRAGPAPCSRVPHTFLRGACTLAGRFFLWSSPGQLSSGVGTHLMSPPQRALRGAPVLGRGRYRLSFHRCLQSTDMGSRAWCQFPPPDRWGKVFLGHLTQPHSTPVSSRAFL